MDTRLRDCMMKKSKNRGCLPGILIVYWNVHNPKVQHIWICIIPNIHQPDIYLDIWESNQLSDDDFWRNCRLHAKGEVPQLFVLPSVLGTR